MKTQFFAVYIQTIIGFYLSHSNALALPELDLTDPVGHAWMHHASEDIINARIAEGYRLFRLDVRNASPLRFTAAFVANTGSYQQTGTGWSHSLTQAQVEEIAADATRRIVDISSYTDNSATRYAVVWVGNTGTQTINGRIIVAAASFQGITDQATASNRRVIDIDVAAGPEGTTYSAILVDREPGNDRCQIIGEGTIEEINERVLRSEIDGTNHEPCSRFQHRIIALDYAGNDRFVYVAESRRGNEKPWWFADLEYHGVNGAAAESGDYIADPAHVEQTDNLGVLADRLQGRFLDIKQYSSGGSERYQAILTDNVQYPKRGPSPSGDATLQQIDKVMQDGMKKWGIPGGTIAVTQDDRLVYAQGYGHSHLSRGTDRQPLPTTPEILFRIASCSKPLTGLAIQKLIEQGRLSLDTTPFGSTFNVEPKDPNLKKVTIRQILEHKSWFPDSLGWASAVTDWTNAAAPAVFANRVDGGAYYQNSNYHLLTLVIEAITSKTYEEYFKEVFLTPLGIHRMRISHPRSEGFTDGPITEAATYSDVTKHNRRNGDGTLTGLEDPNWIFSDWILSPSSRFGASTWAASPVDILRLMVAVNGTLDIPQVLSEESFDRIITGARQFNGESTDPPADANTDMYLLGFSQYGIGSGKRVLDHNGYLPWTTNAQLVLRNDGIKFFIAFNGDISNGYGVFVNGIRVQTSGIIGDTLWPLHNIFNTMKLPLIDRWPDFGFSPATQMPGVDCSAALAWERGAYGAGVQVQVQGTLYRCKAYPFNGWCGQDGYKPGIDASWTDAWEVVDVCKSGVVEGSKPSKDCTKLPQWSVGTYEGGDVVQYQNNVYQCKGWPQSGWCGQSGYEPGVTLYWQEAWTALGACA